MKVQVGERELEVQGPEGQARRPRCRPASRSRCDGSKLSCQRANDERQQRAFHGLARALAQNAIKGVTEGFSKELDIVGVGYKAAVEGNKVVFALGFSHPIEFPIPEGIKIAVDKQTRVTVSGIDRQRVGQVAAEIRGLRKPDPYKQKGIRYVGEVLKKKAGKAGGDAARRSEPGRDERSRPKKTSGTRLHDAHPQEDRAAPPSGRAWPCFRSQTHIYAQVIDDEAGKTLVRRVLAATRTLRRPSSRRRQRGGGQGGGPARSRSRAKEKGIETVVFDRGGFQYHGRIKALADAAREGGAEVLRTR